MRDFLEFLFLDWLDEFRYGDYISGILHLFLRLLLGGAVLVLVVLIYALTYNAIDTSGEATRERATVTDTRYSAPFTTMVMSSNNRMIPIYHPASWYATFSMPGANEEIQIPQEVHEHLNHGDQMYVIVTEGQLSKEIRIVRLAS